MAKDVTTYLKANGASLSFSNTKNGPYEPVGEQTVTATGIAGNKIIWQCEEGIDAITAITMTGDKKVISKKGVNPVDGNPKCWAGKVKNKAKKGDQDKYDISWTDTSGNAHTLDPYVDGDGGDG